MRRKKREHRRLPASLSQSLPGVLTLAAAVVLWKLISMFFPPVFFPGPGILVERMIKIYADPGTYAVFGETLLRIFASFLLSMLIGMALGLLMGSSRSVEIFFDSWIMVLLTVPSICWAFLTVLWFGISQTAPIVTVVLIVFPFVAMNIWAGTKAVEKDLIAMAAVYKARQWLLLCKVLIPQLMPYIFSSLRIALSLSWKIALVAEAFGVGSGVGQQMIYWFQETRVDMMLAWGVSFMIVMVAIDLLVLRTWARRTFAWRPQLAT
jgi:NitT/TauT family transport system permease protein